MRLIRKITKTLMSMKFAVALLILLAAACALSSLVTQGQTYAWYSREYGERAAAAIIALGADDAYHSWWFTALSAVLCLDLLVCNVVRFPAALRRSRALRAAGTAPAKKRAGMWGAWICHLGVLILIAGFALGQMTAENYSVYGVPGQTKPLEDTGIYVTIDDIRVDLREDGTAEQYTAEITAAEPASGRIGSASSSVNNPADLLGYRFYQNSIGYAARVRVFKDEELIQEEKLCAGEQIGVADRPELVIYFHAFYPDYVLTEGEGPSTASAEMNRPAYLYSVYYAGEILGMNVLMKDEKLTIDEYTVLFDEPEYYTVLAVKRDRFSMLALAGGLITLAGLVLAFCLRPSGKSSAVSESEPEGNAKKESSDEATEQE